MTRLGSMDDAAVVDRLRALGLSAATAESLTAGALCSRLAEVPGVSAVLRGAVVSYTNEVKIDLLGVAPALLAERGAVDAEVARQMACGAAAATGADIALSTTGVAGPEPHQGQPVGTVWIGAAVRCEVVARRGGRAPEGAESREVARCPGLRCHTVAVRHRLPGDRAAVRAAAVQAALELLAELLGGMTEEERDD